MCPGSACGTVAPTLRLALSSDCAMAPAAGGTACLDSDKGCCGHGDAWCTRLAAVQAACWEGPFPRSLWHGWLRGTGQLPGACCPHTHPWHVGKPGLVTLVTVINYC